MKGLTGVLQTVLLKLRAEFFSRIAFICEFVFETAIYPLAESVWKIEFDFPDTKLKSDFLIGSAIFPESNFFSLGINTRCFFVEEVFL